MLNIIFFKGAKVTIIWEKKPTSSIFLMRGSQTKIDNAACRIEDIINSTNDLLELTDNILKADFGN